MAVENDTVQLRGDAFQLITVTATGQIVSRATTRPVSKSYTRRREGELHRPKPPVLNPTKFDVTVSSGVAGVGEISYREGNLTHRYTGVRSLTSLPSWAGFQSNERSRLENMAIVDALTRLKDQRVNLGVMAAEAHGTAQMLYGAANWIEKVRRAYRNKDLRQAYKTFRDNSNFQSFSAWKKRYGQSIERARTLSRVPDAWLYYHYGLKPTIDDIDGSLREIYRDPSAHPSFWETVVVGSSRLKNYGLVTRSSGHALVGRAKVSCRESVRCRVRVTPRNEFLARMASTGVTNPAEALWNRLPASFLVDYFFSVGDYLSVLDAGVGWNFTGVYDLTYRKLDSAYEMFSSSNVPPGIAADAGYSCNVSDARMSRKVVSRIVRNGLYPPMYDILPQFKLNSPSMTQVANMLSLLAGSFGRAPFRYHNA